MWFSGEIYHHLRKTVSISLHLFQNMEAEGILSDFFYNTSITLIQKPDKDIARKETTN
jgi:F0F1-type ATP synthase membrane subunit a